MRAIATSVILLGLFAAPVSAQEVFEGPHVGASLGWSGSKIGKGLDLSGNIGYDKAVSDGVLLGVEAEGGRTLANTGATLAGGTNFRVRPSWNWSASARLGTTLAPNTLLYGRAGYTGDRVRVSGLTAAQAVGVSGTRHAAFFGAGLEQAVGQNARFRLEYRRATNGRKDRVQAGLVVGF